MTKSNKLIFVPSEMCTHGLCTVHTECCECLDCARFSVRLTIFLLDLYLCIMYLYMLSLVLICSCIVFFSRCCALFSHVWVCVCLRQRASAKIRKDARRNGRNSPNGLSAWDVHLLWKWNVMELVMGNAFIPWGFRYFYISVVKLICSSFFLRIILDSFHLLERYVGPFMFHAIFTSRIAFILCSFSTPSFALVLFFPDDIYKFHIWRHNFIHAYVIKSHIAFGIESFPKPQHCTHIP